MKDKKRFANKSGDVDNWHQARAKTRSQFHQRFSRAFFVRKCFLWPKRNQRKALFYKKTHAKNVDEIDTRIRDNY